MKYIELKLTWFQANRDPLLLRKTNNFWLLWSLRLQAVPESHLTRLCMMSRATERITEVEVGEVYAVSGKGS